MKKYLITALFLFSFSFAAISAPVFFSWGGESIVKVADFPNTPDFMSEDGSHVDAGYRYKQVTIFFIPVWNYDMEWCGYISDKYYLDIKKGDLQQLAFAAGVNLPEDYTLSFWDRIGGKLVLGGIFIVYILFSASKNNKTEETPS